MHKKGYWWILGLILLSLLSFKSLLRPGYFPMHDDMQAMRVFEMDKCIKDGQIPCRWVPDMGYGYGYPQFLFYSPLPYYVMELFHLGGFQVIDSVKIGIFLGFVLSGLAMYLLGKTLWGNLGGLVSAVFYIFAPYHASDIYTRGAMGEFWAFVFLPLIFWAIYDYVNKEDKRYLLYLSLSIAGLLTTHNITSLAFAPIAGVWLLYLVLYFKKLKLLPKLIISLIWGVGFASFFILPAFFEKQFVHVETMTMGYFNYLAHFVSLKQLFLSSHWGFGSSELGPYDDLSFSVGLFHWLFSLLAVISAFLYRKKEKLFPIISLLFLFGLFAVFMTHEKSSFIWSKISLLAFFQFPWRFLTLVTFITSLLAGSLVFFIRNRQVKLVLSFLMLLLVVLFNAYYFAPRAWYNLTDKEKFSGQLWEKQLTISIFDYLPIFAKAPPSSEAPKMPSILSGKGIVTNYLKGTNWQKGAITAESQVKMQLPFYYFPGTTVWVDKNKTAIDYDNPLGLVTILIPKGEHTFSLRLQRTPIRIIGDYLTIGSFAVLLFWILYAKKIK